MSTLKITNIEDLASTEQRSINQLMYGTDLVLNTVGVESVIKFAIGAVALDETYGVVYNRELYVWTGTYPKTIDVDSPDMETGWVQKTIQREVNTTRTLLESQCTNAGLTLVDGSFETGGTVTTKTDVLWQQATGKVYSWDVEETKVVSAESIPSDDGIGAGLWVDKSSLLISTAINLSFNIQTGTDYTLALSDYVNGVVVEMDNASANTVTIPLNSSVAFPIGAVIAIRQLGAGITSIVGEVGVTILNPHGSTSIAAQYGSATINQHDTDIWILEGNISS